MTDGAYDLVVIDADKPGYPTYVEHAIRLLRPGGVLVMDNMLWHDQVADPARATRRRAPCATSARRCATTSDSCPPCCRSSDGLLVAVKR
jgi:predicted O-methyltransferase YrrM